jgi:O-antigen ligase
MYFKTWVSDNTLNLSCHNYFWLLLCEQGLVGLFLFIAFLGFVLYVIQKTYHNKQSADMKPILAALAASIGIFIIILFFNDLIETSKNGSLFFIYLAILVKLQQLTEENVY